VLIDAHGLRATHLHRLVRGIRGLLRDKCERDCTGDRDEGGESGAGEAFSSALDAGGCASSTSESCGAW
jgi:hypothetical protein